MLIVIENFPNEKEVNQYEMMIIKMAEKKINSELSIQLCDCVVAARGWL